MAIRPKRARSTKWAWNANGDFGEGASALKQAYRILFREGLTISNALVRMQADLQPFPEIQHLIAFTRASERGISK